MERLKPQNQELESQSSEPSKDADTLSQISSLSVQQLQQSSSDQRAQPGEKIGKYEIIHEIGRGGMSIVYKARDHELNRLVAIKLLLPKSNDDSLNMLRFQQEARASSQLEHPNIVKVHDFSTTNDGTPYLVMSYLNGISLADAIKSEGTFSLERWLSIAIQACDALEHAHRAGIVHRDVKPSNFVLAQENGTEVLKLVDFGIAKHSFDDMSLTKTGEVFGSPLYMSPEQCAGSKLDARSDIYSLGCVMYEALAGKPPISGDNSLSTLQKHLTDKPDRLSSLNLKTKNIEQLDRIVMRCLEKKPESRYQNLSNLRTELETLLQGGSVDSQSSTTRTIAIVVGSALLILLVIISCFPVLSGRDPNKKPAEVPQSNLIEVAPTDNSKAPPTATPEANQTVSEKKTELESLQVRYKNQKQNKEFQGALTTAIRMEKLAAQLDLPPFDQADICAKEAFAAFKLTHAVTASGLYNKALALTANAKTPAELQIRHQYFMAGANVNSRADFVNEAEEYYHQAIAAAVKQNNKSNQADALIHLGDCEQRQGNAHRTQAETALRQSKFKSCVQHWKQALALDPSDLALQKKINTREKNMK